jgi:cytochrome c oxidase subunit 3
MQISSNMSQQKNRVHPHKFTLWVAMGSIVMMFAGLTSAYIVKRNLGSWLQFPLPKVFWFSTIVIIASSLTIHIAYKQFKVREMARYKTFVTLTMLLGLLFAASQLYGFYQLHYVSDVKLVGSQSNSSASFLFIIAGLHILHMLGGVVALAVIYFRSFSRKLKTYNATPVEIVATYWHFVDILWIYLFLFFMWAGS